MANTTAKKKKNQAVYIPKPFLRGKPWDQLCLKSSLGLLGGYAIQTIALVLLGSMMLIDQTVLRVLMNALLQMGCYLLFFTFGMANGTQAVTQGEILQTRIETNRPINKGEQDCCYHPVKGFLIALVGAIPFILVGIVFACITTRQMASAGILPSWVTGLSGHSEISAPLAYYNEPLVFTLEDILRILVRMNLMPWVNIFGPANLDNMLLLEHLSPLMMLLPPMFYGLGYMGGPQSRAKIHGDIALGRRKAAKKARRDHKRKMQAQQPQQLN